MPEPIKWGLKQNNIELQKIAYSRQFWVILGLYIILIIPVAFAIDSISLGGSVNGQQTSSGMGLNFFHFPKVICIEHD